MRFADGLRYGLWSAVVATAARNRKEYGVPTAWLTHLVGNTVTLLLPDLLRLVQYFPASADAPATLTALARTFDRRVRQDPRYAGYVAPLALGFIGSHADYSIYHGKWAERMILGFGVDSIPHSATAYGLARLVSESLLTLRQELPTDQPLARPVDWAADHVDLMASVTVAILTLVWEVGEYLAHQKEVRVTGRDPSEVNMQWSLPDSLTDSLSNLGGLLAAITVRRGTDAIGEPRR